MQKSDFSYLLPNNLIAQHPLAKRTASRLLLLNKATGQLTDSVFDAFIDQLADNDVVVFNDTRVIAARLYGHKRSGGKVEMLIERIEAPRQALVHLKASKSPKAGSVIVLEDGSPCEVLGRQADLFRLRFDSEWPLLALLERIGHMPLPPYINRADDDDDLSRYQTVFAQHAGAVAAPTAGLHFDEAMLAALADKGIARAFVTLHVGSGTFRPVRVDDLSQHVMHQEYYAVPQATVDAIAAARAAGGRVIAIGTTAVRALESASQTGQLQADSGDTRLFITPSYRFKAVDGLLTNFHLPESTLLMLVAAFAGYQPVMQAYQHAIAQQYRFFSYGDAMLML